MYSLAYDIIKRKRKYLLIGNAERLKRTKNTQYNQALIDLCDKFILAYNRPNVTIKTDGEVIEKVEVEQKLTIM